MKKELVYKEFLRREEPSFRAPYNPELAFYTAIQSGDIKKTRALCREPLSHKKGLGVLSRNPLQNLRYHFAITVALIARYCIENGLDVSTSYDLSDFYIQKCDVCDRPEQIDTLHRDAALEYATRMNRLQKNKIGSLHVIKCTEYIADHLHTRITVEDLSRYTGLNRSYLSKLFKKETGLSITSYIRQLKIEAAKNMLMYSDYTPSEIASFLAFSDQSYFTEIFREQTGITPGKFRSMHIRKMSLTPKENDFPQSERHDALRSLRSK